MNELVWRVMTDRQTEWWCPVPWRADVVEQDWHAGGQTAMVFKGPDGGEMPQDGFFLEVTPGVQFASTDACTRSEVGNWVPSEPFMIGTWELPPKALAHATPPLPAIGRKKRATTTKRWVSPKAGAPAPIGSRPCVKADQASARLLLSSW